MDKTHVFTTDENELSGKWNPKENLIDLEKIKKEILEEIEKKYLKRDEYKPQNFDMNTIWPHVDARYISWGNFNAFKNDLNIKLKKAIMGWKNV